MRLIYFNYGRVVVSFGMSLSKSLRINSELLYAFCKHDYFVNMTLKMVKYHQA